jgi:hypothetical protein
MANVADLLIQILHQSGVRRVYGLVGDSLNGATESLRKQRDIEWIHVRHEEGQPSPPAPKPISQVRSRSAPAVAARATCIL